MKTIITIMLISVMLFIVGDLAAVSHGFGFRAGTAIPFFDLDKQSDLHLMGGLSYEAWFCDFYSLGIAPYMAKLEGEGSGVDNYETGVVGADLYFKLRPICSKLSYDPNFMCINRIAPFVTLGLGVAHYSSKGIVSPAGAFDETGIVVAPSIGLGASVFFGRDFTLDLGAQYVYPFDDMLDNLEENELADSYLMPFIGIGYRYGNSGYPVPMPIAIPIDDDHTGSEQ